MEGYTWFEDADGNGWWWKNCETPGCANQVCTWLSNSLCHPCSCKRGAAMAQKEAPETAPA